MLKNIKKFASIALVSSLGLATFANAQTLNFDAQGLEPLQNGFHYEGWLIIDGPVSTGKFNVDANGALVDLNGNVIENGSFDVASNAADASLVVLTIEPAGDTDAVPAATKYVGGALENGSATLSIAAAPALGNDFSDTSGSYILATPTNGNDSDENSGVWFLDLSTGSPTAGLNLPELPAGWEYEGWAVIDGQPVSTGRFTNPATADDFSGFSGEQAGPPFPGEDFLVNAPEGVSFPVDLSNAPIVISVEPSPDDSAAPFAFKPLFGTAPANAADHTTFQLDNNAGSAAVINVTLN